MSNLKWCLCYQNSFPVSENLQDYVTPAKAKKSDYEFDMKVKNQIQNGIRKENKEKINNEKWIKLGMLQEFFNKQELRENEY